MIRPETERVQSFYPRLFADILHATLRISCKHPPARSRAIAFRLGATDLGQSLADGILRPKPSDKCHDAPQADTPPKNSEPNMARRPQQRPADAHDSPTQATIARERLVYIQSMSVFIESENLQTQPFHERLQGEICVYSP